MNMQQVYHHIVLECRNGCTDASSAYAWFKRHQPSLVDGRDAPPGLEGVLLRAFLQTINFHAVRENRAALTVALEA